MSTHNVKERMHKATLFFCVMSSGVLLLLAWLMTQINHTPWGLIGASGIILVLTAQQFIRKPVAISAPQRVLENAG